MKRARVMGKCIAALALGVTLFPGITSADELIFTQRVVIEHDPIVGGPVAKVVVNDDQLSDAIGPDSVFPRLAAMLTATDIEIVLPHETAG